MKVYLSGKMRGLPDDNRPLFARWAAWLRGQGYTVFSPGDTPAATPLREAFSIDTAWICAEAEAIAMIPGWIYSKGAVAEKALAEALGLKVILLDDAKL